MKRLGKTCFLVCEVVPCDWDEKTFTRRFFAVIGFYTDTVLWSRVCFSSLHNSLEPFLVAGSVLNKVLLHIIKFECFT